MTMPDLTRIAELLAEQYPTVLSQKSNDPFELVLWEQVAYLAPDDRRLKAFNALKDRVGLQPERITGAAARTLQAIARIGGSIAVKERADRMKHSARSAAILDGLGSLSFAEARKRLLRFPMIGEPGADKILMFSGLFNTFALESNGLRVLLRIGYGKASPDYATSYRSVMKAITEHLPGNNPERIRLHQLLRHHGLNICKQSKPNCGACPLLPYCRYGRSSGKG
jgi:endonuclease III